MPLKKSTNSFLLPKRLTTTILFSCLTWVFRDSTSFFSWSNSLSVSSKSNESKPKSEDAQESLKLSLNELILLKSLSLQSIQNIDSHFLVVVRVNNQLFLNLVEQPVCMFNHLLELLLD